VILGKNKKGNLSVVDQNYIKDIDTFNQFEFNLPKEIVDLK
jgi:hypothetical protein